MTSALAASSNGYPQSYGLAVSSTFVNQPVPLVTTTSPVPGVYSLSTPTTSTSFLAAPTITTVPTTVFFAATTASSASTDIYTLVNNDAMQGCLVTQAGGLQPNGQVAPGCAAMFEHIVACYQAAAPWEDPYDTSQSETFQACMCQTSSNTPFTPDSVLWRNYTGCSECLITFGAAPFASLSTELQRIQNFCSSQNPIAYLFLLRLLEWLDSLQPGTRLEDTPLIGNIASISSLSPLFTTTPPLANLAYGASAPPGGSLGDVTPSLTTYTSTATDTSDATAGVKTITITSIAQWVPTAPTVSGYNPTAGSQLAAGVASAQLQSAMESMASEMVAAGPSQGGPSGPVYKGKHGGTSMLHVDLKLLLAVMMMVIVVGRVPA